MQEYRLTVTSENKGRRLDLVLLESFKSKDLGLSRTHLQKLILEGKIKVEGIDSPRPHYKVKTGDRITLSVEEHKSDSPTAEEIPLDVVYEDEDLAIIDKQPGLVVHPAPGNYEHTLVNALLYRFKKLSDIDPRRPGIVHRLDKETSGLLVIAKNNAAHLALAEQFAAHTIKRKYLAVVKGRMEFDEDVIEVPIGRHPYKRKNMSAGFGRKTRDAKTHYRTLKRADAYSILELKPFTGRTHQLRVHLAYLGHPILGDSKYGRNNEFKRLALHASYIGFIHPLTKKFMEFSSPAPAEFNVILKDIKELSEDMTYGNSSERRKS